MIREVHEMLRSALAAWFIVQALAAGSSQGPKQAADSAVKPFTMKQVWKLDATYTDPLHGVVFRYPSVWKPEKQFGYHPPALTDLLGDPVVGFGYLEGGFPRDRVVGPYSRTNLEGFGIVYSAVPAASKAKCDAVASSAMSRPENLNPGLNTVTIGQRSFSELETGEAGMSQSHSGKLYAIYLSPFCYLFETDIAVSSAATDDEHNLTPAQESYIEAQLLKIMESVQITSRSGDPIRK